MTRGDQLSCIWYISCHEQDIEGGFRDDWVGYTYNTSANTTLDHQKQKNDS